MWELRIAKKAQRNVSRFPRRDQARIVAALEEMARDPFSGDVQQLKTRPIRFRRRVGSYRIFFQLEPEQAHIIVSAIERRASATYRRRR